MKLIKSIILISISVSMLIAAPQTKEKRLKKVVDEGNKATKMLISTLGKNMKKRMKNGSPMKALDFCSSQAYTLTEKVNKKLPKGVNAQRISLKYRNPANAPQGNEVEILKAFQKLKGANVVLPKHLTEEVDKNTFKFYKPLVIKDKACLTCHGEMNDDIDLKRAIASKYPLDNAINYKLGDLRGAVVVTIKR